MLDEVEQSRNRSFLNDPSCTKFGPFDWCLIIPPSCQTSEQIYCGLPNITGQPTPLSCFLLAQKTWRLHNPFPTWRNIFLGCFLVGDTSDQRTARSPWLLQLPLGDLPKRRFIGLSTQLISNLLPTAKFSLIGRDI